MESLSSSAVMTGSVSLLTITVLPDSDAHTFFEVKAWLPSNNLWMACATAPESTTAPSTIDSGGISSMPKAAMR